MLSQQQQQQQQRHLDIWSFPMGSHNIYVDGRRHFKGFTRKSLKFNAIMRCYAQQNIANARHSVCLSLSRARGTAMLTSWGMKTNFDAFGPENGKCFTFFHRNRWKIPSQQQLTRSISSIECRHAYQILAKMADGYKSYLHSENVCFVFVWKTYFIWIFKRKLPIFA